MPPAALVQRWGAGSCPSQSHGCGRPHLDRPIPRAHFIDAHAMGTLLAQQGHAASAAAAASQWRHLHAVLEQLPRSTFAFAYGSGVMVQPGLYVDPSTSPHQAAGAPQAAAGPPGSEAPQSGARPPPRQQPGGPQLDLILAVDDPVSWHAQVLRLSSMADAGRAGGTQVVVCVGSACSTVVMIDSRIDSSVWLRFFTPQRTPLHAPRARRTCGATPRTTRGWAAWGRRRCVPPESASTASCCPPSRSRLGAATLCPAARSTTPWLQHLGVAAASRKSAPGPGRALLQAAAWPVPLWCLACAGGGRGGAPGRGRAL